ncbi:hypothetical protein Syun_020388 [Stephania yunnanensis]|uniref:Cytochrome P450 n=1 Tax=Stephania yunnanensis TaxID=152371 RepID=A0AAP0NRE6_9MAGN
MFQSLEIFRSTNSLFSSIHEHNQLLLLLILTIIVIFFTKKTRPHSPSSPPLPPSPPKLPIIGNLHQLGLLPHRDLYRLARIHGPLFLIHLGQTPTVVVSSSHVARQVMKTHDLIFSSRPNLQFANKLLYGKDVAFSPYGEYWRQVRRVATLQLLSNSKVQSFKPIREQETALMIDRIRESCGGYCHESVTTSMSSSGCSTSTTVDFYEVLMSLTNDVVCRVALGEKYSLKREGRGFRELIREFLHVLGTFNVGDFVPWLAWVNHFNGLNAKAERVFRDLDCFLEKVIQDHVDRRQKEGVIGGGDDCDEDFVDVLLRIEKEESLGVPFSRDNIKAIILDMFAAGTDTTFTAIDWTMAELIRHPQIMNQVQQQMRQVIPPNTKLVTEDTLPKFHHLNMAIKESLRIHPPIPLLVPRKTLKDVVIEGCHVPANTRVIINAWAIGMDPHTWKDPHVFEPKRFDHDDENLIKISDLMAFGGGRRVCPGIEFAMGVVEVALANLLYHFDWEVPGGEELEMSEGSGLTAHRRDHLILLATPHACSLDI